LLLYFQPERKNVNIYQTRVSIIRTHNRQVIAAKLQLPLLCLSNFLNVRSVLYLFQERRTTVASKYLTVCLPRASLNLVCSILACGLVAVVLTFAKRAAYLILTVIA